MDNLQYSKNIVGLLNSYIGFKPYYKWITFNTLLERHDQKLEYGFKPYYKWITFNTNCGTNLISKCQYSFKPYYKWITFNTTICIKGW